MNNTSSNNMQKQSPMPGGVTPIPFNSEQSGGNEDCITHWPDDHDLRDLIQHMAYYRAEKRGFAPGHEMDDWLAAKVEAEAVLDGRHYCGD